MIFFLYGLDSFRSKEKLDEIMSVYRKSKGQTADIKFFDFSNSKISFQEIKDSSATLSLFQSKRLFVIKNFFENPNEDFKEKFIENFDKFLKSEDTFIFYEEIAPRQNDRLFKLLSSKSKAASFNPLVGKPLENWIDQELLKYKAKIDPIAKNTLIFFAGNDLWLLSNEIKKLAAFKDGKTIALEDIKLMVRPNMEAEIFKTMEFIVQKDKKNALASIARHLKNGDAPQYLFYMITGQFRNLVAVKWLLEKRVQFSALAKAMALPPFVARKLADFCQNFTYPELKNIYRYLRDLDLDIKTGRVEPEAALEILIAKI